MNERVRKLTERWYKQEDFQSDDLLLHMISTSVGRESRVLDVGAGTGQKFPHDLKDRVAEMVGVDLDPRVSANPLLHRGICADIRQIPVEDAYFDLAFCRCVLEHIIEPAEFLREMHRVLKPGGKFVFLTPNRRHYVTLGARITPHWFHEWYNARLRGRQEEDTFPTVYRMNTAGTLRRQFAAAGFKEEKIVLRETCPVYLLWSTPLFLVGLAYERLVNSVDLLAGFRVHLLGSFVKT